MLEEPVLEQELKDPRGGKFTIRAFSNRWEFEHSTIPGDTLKIHRLRLEREDINLVTTWLYREKPPIAKVDRGWVKEQIAIMREKISPSPRLNPFAKT